MKRDLKCEIIHADDLIEVMQQVQRVMFGVGAIAILYIIIAGTSAIIAAGYLQ